MQEQQIQEKQTSCLIEKKQSFKIKKPLQKILGFAPMFKNTFVVVAIKTLRYEAVIHYDAQGNILKELVFHDSNLFPYIVPSDREIIWVDDERDLVLQWNLETYELLEFAFKFNNENADSHEIFYFPDTQLICIGEWGRHNNNYFSLTYFDYPLTKQSKPVYKFDRQDVWNYEFNVRRANIKAKFVWWKCAMKEQIQFRTFQLVKKQGKWIGEYLQHKVANPFKVANGSAQLSVGCIWETVPKQYLFVSITNRPHNENEYPNALFVYEQKNKLFRQAKFAFQGKYRFQYIHYYSFGKTAMIKSFDFVKGQAQQSPVYFIDNQNQCIAARTTWKCSHLPKYTFPGYDGNMLVQGQYENGDVEKIFSISYKIYKPLPARQWTTELMLNILPDCDQDLLHQIIGIAQSQEDLSQGWKIVKI